MRLKGNQLVHVAFITNSFLKGDILFEGGAERHLFQLAKTAQLKGIKVTVYQPGDHDIEINFKGLRVRQIPVSIRSIWHKGTSVALLEGCSHIHYQYLGSIPFQRVSAVKTATIHAVWWDYPIDLSMRKWYPFFGVSLAALPAWRIVKHFRALIDLARCRAVLATDTSFLRIVQSEIPELRTRVHTVLNFSDLDVAKYDPSNLPELESLYQSRSVGKVVILVPRNLSIARGAGWLCSIVEETTRRLGDRCEFFVTGQMVNMYGRGRLLERNLEFQLNAMSPQARGNLTFLEGLPRNAMVSAYEISDVVLIPTYNHEGSSIAAIESMAMGRPVVATNIGGLNDVVADGWTGLLVSPTVQDIVDAIERLALDPKYCQVLGERARAVASERFLLANWQTQIVNFMDHAGWLER